MRKIAKNCLPPPKIYRGSLTAWDSVNRKRVYFGKQDDPTSHRKYAEWVQSLAQCPSKSPHPAPLPEGGFAEAGTLNSTHRIQKAASTPTGKTIADLSLAFLDAKRTHSHYYHYRTACKFLKRYSEMETADFDAYCLLERLIRFVSVM